MFLFIQTKVSVTLSLIDNVAIIRIKAVSNPNNDRLDNMAESLVLITNISF